MSLVKPVTEIPETLEENEKKNSFWLSLAHLFMFQDIPEPWVKYIICDSVLTLCFQHFSISKTCSNEVKELYVWDVFKF